MPTKVHPGDGSPLPPLRGWQKLRRSVFGAQHAGRRYDVAVDFFDVDERIPLYVDGRHVETRASPAAFPVPGGRIEVALGTYGLKRARIVTDDGAEHRLEPAHGTLEHWRQSVDRRHPAASRAVSAVSWTVLVAALLVGLTELLDVGLPWLADIADLPLPEASPIHFPAWITGPAAVLGPVAAIDRALMMRHHWLLDD